MSNSSFQGYGWIWRSRFRAYEIFSTGILSSWLFYTLLRSSICLNLKNGGLESRHTSSQIGRIRSPSASELCQIKVKAGSGEVVWGPIKYFLTVFCRADYSTHFESPQIAWISKMAGWSPDIQVLKSDVSGLLQLVSYVKFKVKAGSEGVVLGPMIYFPPVFCRADYSTHFGGSRFAWISKMAGWSPDIQVLKSDVSTIRSPSASELCQIQG